MGKFSDKYLNRNGNESQKNQNQNYKFTNKIENEEIFNPEFSISENDRVVNLIKEAFHSNTEIRFNSYKKIINLGRKALPTLYSILSDHETAKRIAAKTIGIKLKNLLTGNIDENTKSKIELRAIITKNIACTCSSKIVKDLDYEEKSKLASIFQKLLATNLDKNKYSESILQSYEDLKYNILLSIRSLSDAALSLSATINSILKQKDISVKVKNQAILAMAYIAELNSRNSANILINIFEDKSEEQLIRMNALLALGEIGDSLSIEQVDEILNYLIAEIEESGVDENKRAYLEAALGFGRRRINIFLDIIKDRNKKLQTREFACYVCFGIAKKNVDAYDFIVASLDEIRKSLKENSELIYESDDKSILILLEDILKILSY